MPRCTHPILITVKDKTGLHYDKFLDHMAHYIEVPCGKCLACKQSRSKQWGLRCMLENEFFDESVFLTLTYDNEHIPFSDSGVPTLFPRHLQLFFKQLRKRFNWKQLKYYCCGEYGETTFRPHYHVILFGVGEQWSVEISNCWSHGFVACEAVTLATCNYVAQYVNKKMYGELAKIEYQDKYPPFQRGSHGLGERYLAVHWKEIVERGYVDFYGTKCSIPRYFWKLLLNDDWLSRHGIHEIDSTYFLGIKRALTQSFIDKEHEGYTRKGVAEDDLQTRSILQDRGLKQRDLNSQAKFKYSKRNKGDF